MKCIDCQEELGKNFEENEVIVCPCCGLEHEFRNGTLYILYIEGEDWGE